MKHLHHILSATVVLLLVATGHQLSAQTAVGIGSTTFTPDANSILDIRSTNTGVLLPRMASDPSVAGNNDDGLMYFNTSSQTYRYYDENANVWRGIATVSGTNYILNQTTLQTPADYNISGSGQLGTTLGVGTALTVGTTTSIGSTLAVGAGIRVGSSALTPAPGAGNIMMTVDDSWIGSSASTSRIVFDQTADENIKIYPTKRLYVEVADDADANTNQIGMELKHSVLARGVGLKLSGTRNLNAEPSGYIEFENNDGGLATLARVGVRNQNQLNTQGSFHVSLLSTTTGNLEERLALTHEGNLTIDGKFNSQGIQETSDVRFKKNISSISNALSTVLNLEGVTYNWRTEDFPERSFSERMEYGVIAQQIEKFVPELVSTDENGYKSVQYSHMVPLLLEAIKEQQAIINSQSKEIGVLKASVDAISEHIKTAEK